MLGPFELSAPFVIYLEGGRGLTLLLALREPRIHVTSPPRPGLKEGEVVSECGKASYSYQLVHSEGLSGVALDVYADLIAMVSVAVLARRACSGSASVAEAVLTSGLQGLEALAYAVSLGGAVLASREGHANRVIGRVQAAPWLKVVLGGGGGDAQVDVIDIARHIASPVGRGEILCRCAEPRLRVGVELRAGPVEGGEKLVTGVDNQGAVARLYGRV